MIEYRPIERAHLAGIIDLCCAEGWPSFAEDTDRAWQALTAPGVTTMVACEGGAVVGFTQMQSDGAIQAHLSLIAVRADCRHRGVGRRLIEEAFACAGGLRLDLLSTEGAEAFYESFQHRVLPGYRIYPQPAEAAT